MRQALLLISGLFAVVTLAVGFALVARRTTSLDTPVQRAQLRIISDSSSTNVYLGAITVSLNATNETEHYHSSISEDVIFDLRLTNVTTLRDITQLVIRYPYATFDWRPKVIALYINDSLYYQHTLDTNPVNASRDHWFVARRGDIHRNEGLSRPPALR